MNTFLAITSACVVCLAGALVLAGTLLEWADEIERRQRERDDVGLSLFGEDD
jgi:hypothetical protein